MSLLEVYRSHLAKPGRILSVDALEKEGYSRDYARVMLHRLRMQGAAVAAGPNQVKLLRPGEKAPTGSQDWSLSFAKHFKAKRTGFSVLPKRYLVSKPLEFVVPPSKVVKATQSLHKEHPELTVSVGQFRPGKDTVCLYPGRVRGAEASLEEALLHVYRHASREDFAVALQAVLMQSTKLNWNRLRDKPEWRELAGVFVYVNEQAGHKVFPSFRTADPPDLTYTQLATVAQAFTARGIKP